MDDWFADGDTAGGRIKTVGLDGKGMRTLVSRPGHYASAALCGLVGFKPTFGRISTEGVIPYSWTLDHVGTLTRSAADTALLFNVLCDKLQAPTVAKLEGLRIGIPEGFFFARADTGNPRCR